jgi:D-amino peptidase
MTREAVEACEGALADGASEILVKDAHSSGRNLILDRLPPGVRLVRSWAGHPLCMLQELDESFTAVMMIGYHAAAGSEGNALAHTLSLSPQRITINGRPASEFLIHAYGAEMLGVPTVFVSGDEALGEEVNGVNAAIGTCAVKRGVGASTVTMTPADAVTAIREGAAKALSRSLKACRLPLPDHFTVDIAYGDPVTAYRMAWYPGASHAGERTVRFEAKDYLDVLRMLNFLT